MAEVSYDTRTGHCVIKSDTGRVVAALMDIGGACAVFPEGDMSPDEATKLGHALIAWSAWRRRVIPTIDHYERTKQEPTVVCVADNGHPGPRCSGCSGCPQVTTSPGQVTPDA